MTLEELKKAALSGSLTDAPLVLKYSGNKFLGIHYAKNIAEIRNLKLTPIDSLASILDDNNFFDEEPTALYLYDVENLEETVSQDDKNIIVVCKKVPDNLSIDYIEIPDPLNWQVEEFMKVRMPGLDEAQVKWLCEISKYDPYRLDNEAKKIEVFPENMQKIIFENLNSDNAYSDLNSMNIFNFTDAIMNRNYSLVSQLIEEIQACDLEPLGVVKILLKKFVQIAGLQLNPAATAASLGMSDKQFYYLKTHPNLFYTREQIINNIEFLSGIDTEIKSGNLDLPREELLTYFVTKVLAM